MFSNHLAALSDVCLFLGIKLIAVIRSHTPDELNPAIQRLRANGNEILYVAPEIYRSFHADASEERFPGALFIPEGGLSLEGIRGTAEIASEFNEAEQTHVVVAGGTMGTACGLVSSLPPSVKLIIVPAWKGCTNSYFTEILEQFSIVPSCQWELWPQFHFSGFGRFNQQLIDYMYNFSSATGVPLDPVYTGKMMFAINDQIEAGYFNTSDSIVAIHTGGLQGLDGYRYRFPEVWSTYCQLVRH
jgi:1-aminocyclopropane-1-carboxylate deaminase